MVPAKIRRSWSTVVVPPVAGAFVPLALLLTVWKSIGEGSTPLLLRQAITIAAPPLLELWANDQDAPSPAATFQPVLVKPPLPFPASIWVQPPGRVMVLAMRPSTMAKRKSPSATAASLVTTMFAEVVMVP